MSNYKHGHGSMGLGQTAAYRTWTAMKRRCNNPRAQNYKFYGAKGNPTKLIIPAWVVDEIAATYGEFTTENYFKWHKARYGI